MKPKKPGDNISLKTKKNESPIVIDWINSQTNLMDSIRYLIENEVMSNGIRNLQTHIPAQRAISVHAVPIFTTNTELHSNIRNEEKVATQDKQDKLQQSDPSIPVTLTANESLLRKESEKNITDDDIDEEDIDSWI